MTQANAMQPPSNINDYTIYISSSAVNRIRTLVAQEQGENPDLPVYFQITVLSGGCYGFQYKFDFVDKFGTDDLIFKFEGITVIVDEVSAELLKDVTIDYVEELIGAAFTLKNPNASTSCGCGNSFSI